MSSDLIVILSVLSGLVIAFLVSWFIKYYIDIKDISAWRVVEIKSARRFKKLYAIAPERYELKKYSVYGPVVRYGGKDDSYYLFFPNPIGYLIVRRMLKGDGKAIERERNQKNRMESEKGFIKEIERDLKEFKEKEKNENGHDK